MIKYINTLETNHLKPGRDGSKIDIIKKLKILGGDLNVQ